MTDKEMVKLGIKILPDEMVNHIIMSRAVDLVPRDMLQPLARSVFCRLQPHGRVEFLTWITNEFHDEIYNWKLKEKS